MDITTLDRLRAWTDEQQINAYASLLKAQITALSLAFESELGRYLEQTSRTTYCDVYEGDHVFYVKGYPISTAPTCYEDSSRAFSGSAVSSDDYDVTQAALNSGKIEFDYQISTGPSALKIVYTGGLATTTAGLLTSYPDLVMAADKQLWFWHTHKGMLGLDGEGGGQIGGGARKEVMVMTWWQAHGGLLPEVQNAIQKYKSWVPRW